MDGDIEADDRTQLSNLTAANEVIIYAGSPVDMNQKTDIKMIKQSLVPT